MENLLTRHQCGQACILQNGISTQKQIPNWLTLENISKTVHVPRKITTDHSTLPWFCLSCLKESYLNVNVALHQERLWFTTLLANDAWNLKKKPLIIKIKHWQNFWQIYLKMWLLEWWLIDCLPSWKWSWLIFLCLIFKGLNFIFKQTSLPI